LACRCDVHLAGTLGAVRAKQAGGIKRALGDSLRLLWFLTVPSAVGLILLAEPIVRLLFERGKFDANATHHAAFALLFLAPGLISYATVNVVARAFYAMHDTRTPMKIAIMAMVVDVFLAFALIWPLKEGGLALANTLSSTMNACALMVALRGRIKTIGGTQLLASAVRTVTASLAMGVVCWLAWWLVAARLTDLNFTTKLLHVAIPAAVGVLAYGIAAFALRAPEIHALLALVRRKKPRTP